MFRRSDNDVYGHVNNVQYLSYFDTTVNHFLYHRALNQVPFNKTEAVGLCVHSSCDYFKSLEYPEIVEVGLFVSKASRSSIKYEVGVFKQDSPECAAHGQFVHVYVDAITRRPVEVPQGVREAVHGVQRHVS
jgi:acyl-CoA thioester hydrolase